MRFTFSIHVDGKLVSECMNGIAFKLKSIRGGIYPHTDKQTMYRELSSTAHKYICANENSVVHVNTRATDFDTHMTTENVVETYELKKSICVCLVVEFTLSCQVYSKTIVPSSSTILFVTLKF